MFPIPTSIARRSFLQRTGVGLGAMTLGALTGCNRLSPQKHREECDLYCDGKTVSMVVCDTLDMTVSVFTHSGTALVSRHEDSWLVQWSLADLKDEQKCLPSSVSYLGAYDFVPGKNNMPPIQETGFEGRFVRTFGNPSVALCLTPKLSVVKEGILQPVEHEIDRSDPTKPYEAMKVLFTTDRQHFLAQYPERSIYSLPTLKKIKRIPSTEAFANGKFEFGSTPLSLTNDLQHLIAVSSADLSTDSARRDSTHSAQVYHIDSDTIHTIEFPKFKRGTYAVQYFDTTPEGMRWVIADLAMADGWTIVDSQSNVVARIPRALTHLCYFHGFTQLCQGNTNKEFFEVAIEHNERFVRVIRHDLQAGSLIRAELQVGELQVPSAS